MIYVTNQNFNLLNSREAIKSSIKDIINAFVKFYGEDKRQIIEKKLNNMIIITYQTPEQLSNTLLNIKLRESDILINEFLKEANLEISIENKKKYFPTADLSYYNLNPINDYNNYLKMENDNPLYNRTKEGAVKFLSAFYPDVTLENIDIMIKENKFSKEEKLLPIYESIINNFNNLLGNLKPYMEMSEKSKILADNLQRKYYEKYLNEFSFLISKEELESVKERLHNDEIIYNLPKIESYFGQTLSQIGLIDSFKIENEKFINEDSWRGKNIRNDRIKFFKNMGIDLGDNYLDYENNLECQKILPKQEIIEELVNKKEEYSKLWMNEVYSLTSDYIDNRKIIDSADLYDKNDGFNEEVYANQVTCILTNAKANNGELTAYPILCFNVLSDIEYLDQRLIHELNHVYEFDLDCINSDNLQYHCGFDIINEPLNNESNVSVHNKRKYELLNEIINELISQQITTIMHENGCYIFNTSKDAKISHGTSYEKTNFLIGEFIGEYKTEILASRNGDISYLFDKIGEENFEEFNELFIEFNTCFSGFEIYNLYTELRENKDTQNTRIYNELIKKRDIILEKMRNYNLNHCL